MDYEFDECTYTLITSLKLPRSCWLRCSFCLSNNILILAARKVPVVEYLGNLTEEESRGWILFLVTNQALLILELPLGTPRLIIVVIKLGATLLLGGRGSFYGLLLRDPFGMGGGGILCDIPGGICRVVITRNRFQLFY